ncbi:MAG: hypothetical protein ACRDNB_04860 [Gaiellaceae bacterium]
MSDQSVAAATPDDLVAELARATVERAAPEELPLFGPISEAYQKDPKALESGRARDEMLGFGAEAAVMLVTPVALQVARDVLGFLHEQLRERAREHGEGAIDRIIARLVGMKTGAAPAAEPVPELSDAQLEQVRALAFEKARTLKLSEERAELLADSLVGSLATA